MEITEEKLRDIVEKWIMQKGVEGTINYISTGDYPAEIKKRALNMVQVKTKEELENQSAMAENGDISDMNF